MVGTHITHRLSNIITLSRQAFGQYKLQIIGLAIFGLIGGVLEGLGVTALIPLFSFTLGNGEGGADPISRLIKDFFEFFDLTFSVRYLLTFIAGLFILKALTTVWLNYVKSKITTDYEQKERSKIFAKILGSEWSSLLKQKLGYLETILMLDVPAVSSLLNQLSNFLIMIITLAIYLIVAINISPKISLFILGIGLLIFLFSQPLLSKIKQYAYLRTQLNKDTAHHVNENLLGLKIIKSLNAEEGVKDKGNSFFIQLRHYALKSNLLKSLPGSLHEPIGVIFVLGLFALSYRNPSFSMPALIVIVYLVDKIFTHLQQIQRAIPGINDLFPHLRSIVDFEQQAEKSQEKDLGRKPFQFSRTLEFRQVEFFYDTNRPILKKIDFCIKKGEMIGFIGPSGVGKTTVVDLILRLFEAQKGNIFLDGVDISQIRLDEWRSKVGYVSQDIFLLNDTIRNNIRFYDVNIKDADIERAARDANILEFINSKPSGFEAIVGERGVFLSAGQRQRVAIARVLARKPEILILDEATSALDNESEAQFQKVIKNLKGKVTVLVIAHRLSTVADTDQLIVLEDGQVSEQGKPGVLLKDKESYFFRAYNILKI
ncbi:MAG: ABC transporter related protein [Parcubacteria group bacterium GW2011_GWA2_51_12]|nr:MAG: ABC transporter related protein [Parcubacteria group bacterium GW2011_GWA2_51_12]